MCGWGVSFSAPSVLVECLAAGLPCVASAALAEAARGAAWLHPVPDSLSPVRLAEAVLRALDAPPPTDAQRHAYAAARSMDSTAARLLALLGLAP